MNGRTGAPVESTIRFHGNECSPDIDLSKDAFPEARSTHNLNLIYYL